MDKLWKIQTTLHVFLKSFFSKPCHNFRLLCQKWFNLNSFSRPKIIRFFQPKQTFFCFFQMIFKQIKRIFTIIFAQMGNRFFNCKEGGDKVHFKCQINKKTLNYQWRRTCSCKDICKCNPKDAKVMFLRKKETSWILNLWRNFLNFLKSVKIENYVRMCVWNQVFGNAVFADFNCLHFFLFWIYRNANKTVENFGCMNIYEMVRLIVSKKFLEHHLGPNLDLKSQENCYAKFLQY